MKERENYFTKEEGRRERKGFHAIFFSSFFLLKDASNALVD